jgi:DNA polymerase-3 subunit delta'
MLNTIPVYPWQKKVWDQLNLDGKRRAHALLLHGRAGIGKYDFAHQFSQALLCLHPDKHGYPCGVCSSCNWFKEESHPDFRLISPEQEPEAEEDAVTVKKTKKKTQISVAQIRVLSDFLNMSSHRSDGNRIVLIHPAEALNQASANALLKMLEEPTEGVIFILVTHQLQRLLPTIISRCQKINMPLPDDSQALAWLNKQGVKNAREQLDYLDGSPLKVLNEQLQFPQLMEICRLLSQGSKIQPHTAAQVLISNSVEVGIIAMQKWIYDIVAMRLTQKIRYHTSHTPTLQALADKVNLSRLFQLQRKVDALRKLALHPLNHELQMENLLQEYTKIFY